MYYTGFASSILNGMLLLCGTARTQSGIYKNAVFDTKEKSPFRHISTEKGLKIKGFRGFDVFHTIASEALFLLMYLFVLPWV